MTSAEATGTNSVRPLQLAAYIAAGLAVGAAAAFGARKAWLNPQQEAANVRYETLMDVTKLYDLQEEYFKAHGVYADGLDTLLTSVPDREAFKKRMASHLDLTTIAIVGGPKKFRVEANALDKDRSLIKLRGPILPHEKSDADIRFTEASTSAGGNDGAPVPRRPSR
ncbi:MAG: hypothetical protein KGL74_02855 [Elusimicrobia bacterium]|nr:hypothetical protein [Elusimicrobiota bacterium]